MKMDLVRACPDCPFRREGGIRVRRGRVDEIAGALLGGAGAFPCHRTIASSDADDDERIEISAKAQHCAGALIFVVKHRRETIWMNVTRRLGVFDPARLEGADEIFGTVAEFRAAALGGGKHRPTKAPQVRAARGSRGAAEKRR